MNADFDDLLARSAPPTSGLTPEVREELSRMAADGAPRRSARRPGLLVGSGIAAVALFGGVGAAAASGIIDWGPWASDPDVVYAYVLPNDEPCELRVVFDDDATGAVARDLVAGVDLGAEIDVDAAIAMLRAMPSTGGDEFGNSWDVGYGTEFYPGVDEEFDRAVGFAVSGYLSEELTRRGVDPQAQDATFGSTCSVGFANEG